MFRDRLDFCSNFFWCRKGIRHYDEVLKVTITVNDSEILYQVAKTLIPEERKLFFPHIFPQKNPRTGKLEYGKPLTAGEAKRMGKSVTLRADWDSVCLDVMRQIVHEKFEQNEDIRERLIATGNEELVEVNYWHDNKWGDCQCGKRESCRGKGRNWLGATLMRERYYWTHDRQWPEAA